MTGVMFCNIFSITLWDELSHLNWAELNWTEGRFCAGCADATSTCWKKRKTSPSSSFLGQASACQPGLQPNVHFYPLVLTCGAVARGYTWELDMFFHTTPYTFALFQELKEKHIFRARRSSFAAVSPHMDKLWSAGCWQRSTTTQILHHHGNVTFVNVLISSRVPLLLPQCNPPPSSHLCMLLNNDHQLQRSPRTSTVQVVQWLMHGFDLSLKNEALWKDSAFNRGNSPNTSFKTFQASEHLILFVALFYVAQKPSTSAFNIHSETKRPNGKLIWSLAVCRPLLSTVGLTNSFSRSSRVWKGSDRLNNWSWTRPQSPWWSFSITKTTACICWLSVVGG